jgi:hypothetical protein
MQYAGGGARSWHCAACRRAVGSAGTTPAVLGRPAHHARRGGGAVGDAMQCCNFLRIFKQYTEAGSIPDSSDLSGRRDLRWQRLATGRSSSAPQQLLLPQSRYCAAGRPAAQLPPSSSIGTHRRWWLMNWSEKTAMSISTPTMTCETTRVQGERGRHR